ncbi:TPA: hypothetical protein I7562_16780 [Vibrio cholerae]|nr:hypothetical protein [Vibrio cholerae]
MLYVEFLFLLLMLYIGSRYGGIGLGVVSGIGLVIEVFVFKMPPTSPPITVMLIILAVVTCASILEAAGGLKYMLQVAERMLRKNPKRVTLIAPFVTYTMTFMLGTGHAVYSIMPIIGDVALKNGIRPERPMAAASVASQIAITASPISAAVVYYLAELANINHNITLLSILMVTIPATLFGTLLMSLYSLRRGKELDNDPEYQARLQDPVWREKILNTTATSLDETLPALYGYFFIPNYPSDIATVNFDNTGTTKIGKWYFNHSFMAVGLISVISACCVGFVLSKIIIG